MKNMQKQTVVAPGTRERQSPAHHPLPPSRRRFPALALVALAAGLHLAAQTARAALLAYEGFNYTNAVGASIGGLNGGTGWIAAYPTPSGTIMLTNGLSYPLANTSGKAMRFQGNANMQNGGRKWTNSLPNGTYWYSFLINPLTVATGGSGTEPSRGTFCPLIRTNQNQDGLGIRLDNNAGSPQFKALIASSGPNLEFPDGYDKAYYIIGKAVINITGSTTNVSNTIWVYQSPVPLPTTEADLTNAPTSTVVDTGGAAVAVGGGMGGRAFGSSAPIPYDEVRIGQAFADVLPVLGTFTLSPSSGIEGQTIGLTWAVPTNFTSVTLNPGSIDLTGLTGVDGTGTTSILSPTTNTTYVLSYQNGSTVNLTNQFTAVAPSFTLNITNGWEGDTLNFNWQVPVGSTNVSINPTIGSVTPNGVNGTGANSISAPNASTEYVLSYTYNDVTVTLTNQFTLLPPYFTIPSGIVANTANTITWRIPVGFTDVVLEYGPVGGPYAVSDLFTNTVTNTGFGTLPFYPAATNLSYFLRYTNNSIGYVLSSNIVVYPEIFTNLTAIGNGKPVVVNPYLLYAGVSAYSDRSHAWDQVPTIIQGGQFVKFGQDDKASPALSVSFTAATNCTFFLLLDNRVGDNIGGTNAPAGTDSPPVLTSTMLWVLSSGFVDSGVDIGLDENPSTDPDVDQTYSVYFRQVSAGESYTFYEQNDLTTGGPGGRNMYGMAAVAPQVVPVAFVGNPDVITNFSATTLQWTVPLGSTAVLTNWLNGVTNNLGNVAVDVTFGTGSTNIYPLLGTNYYTLTYDPPGAGTPKVKLGPVSVVVLPFPAIFTSAPPVIVEGENSQLQWTVPIDSTVSINNGVGDVTGYTYLGVGQIDIITPPLGTNYYTLTYDPPGASTPPVTLDPVSVIVNHPPPFNLSYSVTGDYLTIEWPAAQLGWILQSQTNTLGVGLSTNWMDVPGSESSTTSVLPVDNSVPASFFRLRSP